MDIPSVAIDVHHRYTPEIRDLIDQKLRTAMAVVDDAAYRLLTPGHLRRLVEIASPDAPVLSLYLQLTPDRRVGRAWHAFFSSLATATLHRFASRREREAAPEEFDCIEQVLTAELPALGRGVAFFVCRRVSLLAPSRSRCRCRTAPTCRLGPTSGRWCGRSTSMTASCSPSCRMPTIGSSSARSGWWTRSFASPATTTARFSPTALHATAAMRS